MSTKVKTGVVRLTYANIWEPRDDDEGKPWYQTGVLIPKEDTATLEAIEAAIQEAINEGKQSKWGGKVPPKSRLKHPLRDGDEEADDKGEAYRGHYFFNCKTKTKPQIVKPTVRGKDGKMQFEEITDETLVYSGCYVRVSVNFYPFTGKSDGVAVGLNNIVFVKAGEPLGGAASKAEDDFADDDFDYGDNDGGEDW